MSEESKRPFRVVEDIFRDLGYQRWKLDFEGGNDEEAYYVALNALDKIDLLFDTLLGTEDRLVYDWGENENHHELATLHEFTSPKIGMRFGRVFDPEANGGYNYYWTEKLGEIGVHCWPFEKIHRYFLQQAGKYLAAAIFLENLAELSPPDPPVTSS